MNAKRYWVLYTYENDFCWTLYGRYPFFGMALIVALIIKMGCKNVEIRNDRWIWTI